MQKTKLSWENKNFNTQNPMVRFKRNGVYTKYKYLIKLE